MLSMLRLALMCMFLCAVCAAQKPKFLIVTDMEGVGGVNNAEEQLLPGQRRYDESRRLLVGEINAAIEGLLEAGAGQVVVWDGHDGSRSLSIADIDPVAELIQGVRFRVGAAGPALGVPADQIQGEAPDGQP